MKDGWLTYTKEKLDSGKLTVGFLGGSITCGGGATDPEKTSWRAGVMAWLSKTYPQAAFIQANAGLGGTGSDLGAFRCRRDLISHLPDLIFVEFAVNDGGMDKDMCQRSMEGIVRHILGHCGNTDIVFIYTAVTGFADDYRQGRLPRVASWHQEVADYYGLPSVNAGAALWDEIHKGNADWSELLPDSVHPSDRGYAIYTDVVVKFLKEHLDTASGGYRTATLPSPMTKAPIWDGQLLDSWKIPASDLQGWTKTDKSLCGSYEHYIEAAEPGSEFTVSFDGTVLGLYWMVAEDSGDILWSLDGGEFKECRCWDEWGAKFRRANYRILADGLTPGRHLLHIRVSGDKAGGSTGTAIRIAAFLVAGHSNREQPLSGPVIDFRHGDLKVHQGKRFLQHSDGTPFFWLGDTAWELFHRSTREEAAFYLEDRRQKGFSVVQSVVLAEFGGLTVPNRYGAVPLKDNDPASPLEYYFTHVDYIVETALAKGICIGVLPTWGDKVVTGQWGQGPVVFNEENAESYGYFLGNRYSAYPNIIWILGGDRAPDGYEQIWRAMAKGLKSGDGGRHLTTYHPWGGHSSAQWLHSEDWLDFNMLQSGHALDINPNYAMVEADYVLAGPKPCIDGEPPYEDHPVNWNPGNRYFDDNDARRSAYWALFAGAHGHTYGCNDIWQFWTRERDALTSARTLWWEALDLPGAYDMTHVRRLMLSRPFFSRIPYQGLLVEGQREGAGHIQGTKGDGYAMAYIPQGLPVALDLGCLNADQVKAWWYDPRTGEATLAGEYDKPGYTAFTPPSSGLGCDWVIVIDDARRNFEAPGNCRI